jgi:CDP-diacylglycerol--glycerol-3-phosphate 3-phosphatidyltransferase
VAALHEREQLWNLPNTITIARLAVLPVLAAFPWFPEHSTLVGWLFILSSVGDIADGYLARRSGTITSIGKHLDPLADKLTSATALIVLLSMAASRHWGWRSEWGPWPSR